MEKYQFFLFLTFNLRALTLNLIINADFESPIVNPDFKTAFNGTGLVQGWNGAFQIAGINTSPPQFTSQYIDMATNSNGVLNQLVTLPKNGSYVLALQIIAANTSYSSFQSAIYFDSILLGYASPTSTSIQKIHFQFISPPGVFQLSFIQIGIQDIYGVFLDNVCLEIIQDGQACGITGFPIENTTNTTQTNTTTNTTQTNTTTNTTQTNTTTNQIIKKQGSQKELKELSPISSKILKTFLSLPTSQMGSIRYLSLFLDDLWMYSYDKRYYNKTLYTIFETINKIEDVKWTLLNYQQKIRFNKSMVPITDMTDYSNKKHVQMDQVDDCFARGALQFCTFTVIQTVIICFIFKRIFLLLFNYKVSIFFRRYYFMIPVIIQVLLESNVPFFTYLFFRQASIPFFFNFTDKIFLAFSYFAYFWIMILAFCFYLLANEVYQKKFGYFIYCFYRCFPAVIFLTFKHFIRGFVKGVIHAVLHYDYKLQITFLCGIEFLVIGAAIWAEKRYKIFLTKSMFCLLLLYHFHFIILNILLYTEQTLKDSLENRYDPSLFVQSEDYNMALNNLLRKQPLLLIMWTFQTIITFSQAVIVVIEMIVEFFPNDIMNPQKLDELENGEIIGVEVYDQNGNTKLGNNWIQQFPQFNLDPNNPVSYPNSKQKTRNDNTNGLKIKVNMPQMVAVEKIEEEQVGHKNKKSEQTKKAKRRSQISDIQHCFKTEKGPYL